MLYGILLLVINAAFFALEVGVTGLFPKPLSQKQEKDALERMKNGDASARDELIEKGGFFAELLAKGAVAPARDAFAREAVPGRAVADLRRHAAAPVVDIFRAGVAGDGRNALQAVDKARRLAVLRALNHHAVTIEYIISERSCHIFACRNAAQQPLRFPGRHP